MPILGDLKEFPLPEVLLLVGSRTGRLRLLDVPEFGMMDIDLCNGEMQAIHLGSTQWTEDEDLLAKLGAVVQAESGMFEFRLQPVASISRERPLMINQLVMSLVCHVDQALEKRRTSMRRTQRYVLEPEQPEIWIEPELHVFFSRACPFLEKGIECSDLAVALELDREVIQQNLTNLRLLGLVRTLDVEEEEKLATESMVQEAIARKSNEFLRASRVASEIKRLTARLPNLGRN